MMLGTCIFILMLLPIVRCSCPMDGIRNLGGQCNYNIHCRNTVKSVKLQRDCQGSSNYDVFINVTLRDAPDNFDASADMELLSMVTTFRVSGNWPQTNLTFLYNMYRLKTLQIIGNNIQAITTTSPFGHLSRLEDLNLSGNHLSDIETLFQFDLYPNKLRILSLAHNSISEIPEDTFSVLTNLVELDLSYNFISELNEEPFYNLTSLEKIFLNNNNIKDLNGAMNNLLSLKHLYIAYNEIQNISPESLKVMYHLETFDARYNQLWKIKPIMFLRHWYHFGEHSVCKIILAENQLTDIPNATSIKIFARHTRNPKKQKVDVFTQLNLSKNSISRVAYNAFQAIIQLIWLDMSCNKLDSFLINADDLRFVKFVNLSTNNLHKLHFQSFVSMKSLQNLDLSHNQMEYFPDQSLSNSYMIKLINMTDNDITVLKSLKISFDLEGGVLDLSNNSLSYLNLPRGDANGLTILILSSNNISNPYLIKLNLQPDLVQLYMTYNYIKKLDKSSLQLPAKLGFLDLSHNLLSAIGPASFANVNNLKTLRLSHNLLTNIEYGSFQGLSSLQNLDLAYNQIQMLDSKLMMDLKQLSVLSIRNNGMNYLDSSNWISHKCDLRVFVDNNNFSCEWLADVLSDFNNGLSKMQLTILSEKVTGHSIEGIPCEQDAGNIISYDKKIITDERLLITSQKILNAIQEQTSYLRKFRRFILNDAERNERT